MENPLIYVLADIEYEGVKIDHDTLKEFSQRTGRLTDCQTGKNRFMKKQA